jgi:hypothetical protein
MLAHQDGPEVVTNSLFLRELGSAMPTGCVLWAAAFIGTPDSDRRGVWSGHPYTPSSPGDIDKLDRYNTYFSVAALRPDGAGEVRRRKANFSRLLCLVCDDVALEDLSGRASYVLATSPGKRQVGVFLDGSDADCADGGLVDRLMGALAAKGLVRLDTAGNNIVRYVRLPVGQNQKQRPCGPFAHQIEEWSPEVRLTLADAASVFGVELDDCRRAPTQSEATPGADQQEKLSAAIDSVLRGERLHDSIRDIAASLVSSGTAPGAAVNVLRALMERSNAPRDDRYRARLNGIGAAVTSAQEKYGPRVDIRLMSAPPAVRPMAPALEPRSDAGLDIIPVDSLRRAGEWMSGLFDSPTPAITTAGAIALSSVLTGRLYRSQFANWPSLLMAVVGPSGVGKNYIKTGIERILMQAGLQRMIAGDFYTHQAALYWALRESPCHICISDEFGENFMEARKNNNANKLTVFKALKKAYSDADHLFKAESYSMAGLSKKQREEVETGPIINPALTMLGLSTVHQFWGEIRIQHIESGLINRFIIVTVDASSAQRTAIGDTTPPDWLVDWCKVVRRMDEPLRHTAYSLAPSPFGVTFNDQATSRFEAFRKEQDTVGERLEQAGMGAMTRRWRENAMRMATGLAACDRPSSPIVNGDLADWSCRYVQFHGLAAIDKVLANSGENDYQAQLNQVLRLVRTGADRGVSDYEMKGALRGIRRREMGEILAHLAEAGLIAFQDRPANGKGGRPTKAWFATEPEGDE